KGVWPPDEQRWPLFVPTPLRGATLGLIGYGSIGRELARIAKTAFAMTVLACKRDPKRRADAGYCPPGTGDPAGALPDEWFSPDRLDALLARSDVVVMCAPLTRETHHMIGARQLRAMKPTAYLINVGRGASVDEDALAQALKEGRIAGAAVDVFAQEPPPIGHPLYAVDKARVAPRGPGLRGGVPCGGGGAGAKRTTSSRRSRPRSGTRSTQSTMSSSRRTSRASSRPT